MDTSRLIVILNSPLLMIKTIFDFVGHLVKSKNPGRSLGHLAKSKHVLGTKCSLILQQVLRITTTVL